MTDKQSEEVETSSAPGRNDDNELVLPLHAEEISVSKRIVPKTTVQVSTITHQHEEVINELLARERVEIERVAIGEQVDVKPEVREEGDTIIVPVVEEVATVVRHLVLKEEIRIRIIRSEEQLQERVVLRKQEAIIKQTKVEKHVPFGGEDSQTG
jgi:stress response protein YsnF